MKYVIAVSAKSDGLEKRVQQLIEEGFQPHGSMAAVFDENAFRGVGCVNLYQPMIKYDSETVELLVETSTGTAVDVPELVDVPKRLTMREELHQTYDSFLAGTGRT